jgi:RimJ/RimL family protein N-acetyltransferase
MSVPALESDRLLLRPRIEAHMDAMMDMAADPEVMRFFTSRPDDDPEAYRADLLSRVRTDDGPGLGYWSIYAKTDPDRYLGWVSLSPMPEAPEDIELGYRLIQAAWGKGIVNEASRRVLEYGFSVLGLPEIVAIVHPENVRSQAAIGRLGFGRDGFRLSRGGERFFYRLAGGK